MKYEPLGLVNAKNTRTIAEIIKEYIIPIAVALIVAGSTYATLLMKLDNSIRDLGRLEDKVYANEEKSRIEHDDLLIKVSEMNAKIDYIYDWVKELRGAN